MSSSIWPLAAVASLALVAVLASAFRTSTGPRSRNRDLPDNRPSRDDDWLERLEHAVDAIALEVERIGEGQRFVTKILSETRQRGEAVPIKNTGSD
jgi:hypothetical protein